MHVFLSNFTLTQMTVTARRQKRRLVFFLTFDLETIILLSF